MTTTRLVRIPGPSADHALIDAIAVPVNDRKNGCTGCMYETKPGSFCAEREFSQSAMEKLQYGPTTATSCKNTIFLRDTPENRVTAITMAFEKQ